VGGTHFGSSAETRSSFGPEFHLRLGGARPTEVDAPDDSSFSHGAFAVSFGATHPEQVALGRQVRMGWLYRRWGGELDAAVLAQNVRGTWSGGMDLHFVVPVPIRPGLLMEIPFGVACAPSLSPGESYYGFHAGLRVRVGR
jgi:hypothetical protein